jgi:hypothetical protein
MRLLTRREIATVGGKFTSNCTCSGSPLNSASSAPKSAHTSRMICAIRSQRGRSQGPRAWLDRDINAAVNVARAAGLAVTACKAQVSPEPVPAQRGEAGTHPKSRQEVA